MREAVQGRLAAWRNWGKPPTVFVSSLLVSSWGCYVFFSPKLPVRLVCHYTSLRKCAGLGGQRIIPPRSVRRQQKRRGSFLRGSLWHFVCWDVGLLQWTCHQPGVWLFPWGDIQSFNPSCLPSSWAPHWFSGSTSGAPDKQYRFCTQRFWSGPRVHYFNWLQGHSIFMAESAFYFLLQTLSRHGVQLSLPEMLQLD